IEFITTTSFTATPWHKLINRNSAKSLTNSAIALEYPRRGGVHVCVLDVPAAPRGAAKSVAGACHPALAFPATLRRLLVCSVPSSTTIMAERTASLHAIV